MARAAKSGAAAAPTFGEYFGGYASSTRMRPDWHSGCFLQDRLGRFPLTRNLEMHMATITITDLPASRELDRKAMSSVRGALSWVNGAFRAFLPAVPAAPLSIVNFYQVNNTFVAENLIAQFQTVEINNAGDNSSITAVLIGAPSNA
jgi:hypothetical protein